MSSAHVFYIPVIFLVGILIGYFLGRRAAEMEREEARERLKRRRTIRDERQAGESTPEREAEADPA